MWDSFPFEHNELLFLVGGNLGTLAGDFDFAGEVDTAIAFVRCRECPERLRGAVRTRKLAEVLSTVGRVDEAESLLTSPRKRGILRDDQVRPLSSRCPG